MTFCRGMVGFYCWLAMEAWDALPTDYPLANSKV